MLYFKNSPEGWVRVDSPKDLADVTETDDAHGAPGQLAAHELLVESANVIVRHSQAGKRVGHPHRYPGAALQNPTILT